MFDDDDRDVPESPDDADPGSCDYYIEQDGTEHMEHEDSGKSWTYDDKTGKWKDD